jgi:hypothetical protein
MVNVAQSVEPRIVIPVVVGSSPIVHPNQTLDATRLNRVELMCFTMSIGPLAQLVEQLTLNQRVLGSSPRRPTNPCRGRRTPPRTVGDWGEKTDPITPSTVPIIGPD